MSEARPLICHIVHRLDFGGLENGLVNLINRLPRDEFRHSVISLTEVTEFARRIEVPDVELIALGKKEGKDPGAYWRLFRSLRHLNPQLVHTRNLGTLDCQAVAWAAGVPHRVHGEHGWDVHDPEGLTPRYVRLRRTVDRLVHRYVALSGEIEHWLLDDIGIRRDRITRICNGVDTNRFRPATSARTDYPTVGTVSRLAEIKSPEVTLQGFAECVRRLPDNRARLLIVGGGPMADQLASLTRSLQLNGQVEFAGEQPDVLPWLQKMHVFVLASKREGISNTVLEAMACGLPVIATRTGGNPELVSEHETGILVEVGDVSGLCEALIRLLSNPAERCRMSIAARTRAVEQFSMERMTQSYADLYRNLLRRAV